MILKAGAMVSIAGVAGFGLINEILFACESKTTLVKLEFWAVSDLIAPQTITILASDCQPYTPAPSRAKNVYHWPDDHVDNALLLSEAA